MNTGKTLFAQLMDFLPWTTFTRIVDRYGGDHRVRTLSCAEQYRSMAFAQLTYRESLRDIETCLSVHASKLYHMGFRQPVRRSTLADANERRDWRIHAALAQRLITQARTLYVDEELGLDLTNTVYALDSTTIALCLSVFPWAHFRTTKAAVKMHTLLDLRGNIPSFIHISDGKLHDVHALDMLLPEAGAIYAVDRGYVDFMCCTKPGPSSSRVPSRTSMLIASIRRRRIARPASFATRPSPWTASGLPRTSAAHPLQGPRVRQDAGLHHQQLLASGRHHLRALQKPLAGGTLLQVNRPRFTGERLVQILGCFFMCVQGFIEHLLCFVRRDISDGAVKTLGVVPIDPFQRFPFKLAH